MVGSDSAHGILDSLCLLLSLNTTVHLLYKLMDLTPLEGGRQGGRGREGERREERRERGEEEREREKERGKREGRERERERES